MSRGKNGKHIGPSTFDDTMQRLPGLRVQISTACTACGECHAVCPVRAIDFDNGFSVINQDLCKGCGLCVAACTVDAPQLYVDESTDVFEIMIDRIRARTDVGL